jgi:hypothetical protein
MLKSESISQDIRVLAEGRNSLVFRNGGCRIQARQPTHRRARWIRLDVYSCRKARIGSTPAARRAGIQPAAMAIPISSAAEAAKGAGSQEFKP